MENQRKYLPILNLIKYILRVIVIMLLGFSYINESQIFSTIAILMMGLIILIGNNTDDFYLYIFLLPFSDFVAFGDRNILFVFHLISIFKIIYSNMHKRFSLIALFSFLLLIGLITINDFPNISIGRYIYIVSIIAYYSIFILLSNFSKINRKHLAISIFTTIFVVLFFIVLGTNGNIFEITGVDETNRLGEETRQLGGAMGVPIYIMMFITCTFVYLTSEKTNKLVKMMLILISLIFGYIGFLTLSRVYLLGLAVFLVMLILSQLISLKRTNQKIKIILYLLVFALAIVISITNLEGLINMTINRGQEDISTGRFDIYSSIFDFLKNNPLNLLIGKGVIYYSIYGKENGYLFSMTAHNLYLDSIMSWGLLGTVAFLTITFYTYSRLSKDMKKKVSIISMTPMIVWLAMVLVGDSFYYFKTYITILSLIMVSGLYGKVNKDVQEVSYNEKYTNSIV